MRLPLIFKGWHLGVISIGGTGLFFLLAKLFMAIFPRVPESTVLSVGFFFIFAPILAIVSWALYTNFGKEAPLAEWEVEEDEGK